MSRKVALIAGSLGLILLLLAACATPAEETTAPAVECPEPEPCPACPECPAEGVEAPFEALWAASPHADAEAEAFRHWDEEDPAEVPVECAKCHSTPGYVDFVGADGTAFGSVENAAPIGTVITCEACHNEGTTSMTSVVFPSGVEITGLGAAARCMQCHQGRASGASVDQAIADLGLTEDLDTASADLRFINIHYYAAAASLFGSEVHAGYEYAGNSYQIRFAHVDGYTTCTDCHNPHTTEVKVEECAMCHTGVASVEDVRNIRMQGSLADYDGDGDATEPISAEIAGLQEKLYQAMQAYAAEVAGTPILYDAHSYPYFFVDTNGNGAADEGEVAFPNAYNAWTGRLLQAAYNYQASLKDPGSYVHNAKYYIALLYDSIMSLNEVLSSPVDMAAAHRNDPGHFDGTAEAFRHWDAEGEVPGSCARCHSAEGVAFFLKEGVNVSAEPANSFACHTCHTFEEGIAVISVGEVTFPSGAVLSFGEGVESNLCLLCHQGRSSTPTVNRVLGDRPVDTPDETISFQNIHYFAAGATLFGGEAQGAYQYAGKEYLGRFEHVNGFNTCADCHDVHALTPNVTACSGCHGSEEPETYRISETDFDGDGDVTEGIAGEIETMSEALYVAMQTYAVETGGIPIAYNSAAYPYFFVDVNGDGLSTPDEAIRDNRYLAWTPRLLRAAFNYQYVQKDPGAFAHNGKYIIQVLYDSLEDIGGAEAVAGMTRP
ncbi:MAG: hypothetical protein Kow00124_23730 [Anaerolineae bacterium]